MEFYKKIFLNLNIVLLLIAFCLAQTESNTDPIKISTVELELSQPLEDSTKGYSGEEKDTEIETINATPLLYFYTPLSIFPSDETKYTTNETLIQQLLKLNEKESEIVDLNRENTQSNIQYTESQENYKDILPYTVANNIEINENRYVKHSDKETQNISDNENDYSSDLDKDQDGVDIPKSETEWIENGENTEDDKMNVSVEVINETINSSTVHYTIKSDYFGIFAGFFIIIVVIIYLTVTAWRRMIRQRYRHREMLVNEEEFYDPSDMKHFSI